MFDHLMKSCFERMLMIAFALALVLSVGSTIASSISASFEKVNQALSGAPAR